MENPKPTKSVSVSAGTRLYYFDAQTDKKGQPYVTITEAPTENNPGNKKRSRIFVHVEDLDNFAKAFVEISNHVKNASKR